jgi:crossover junction endodeoxyribonuclease RuvC
MPGPHTTRVLGVDPGPTRCGVGVVDGGRDVSCVGVIVVRTPAGAALAARLLAVADTVDEWLDLHRPDAVAIQRVFSQRSSDTAMDTALAGGVVALAAARRGLPVGFHTPGEVKAAVTGSGRAGKAQVVAMVTRLLSLEQAPISADAAGALALAICHLWREPVRARLEQAERRSAALARKHRARLAAARARTVRATARGAAANGAKR